MEIIQNLDNKYTNLYKFIWSEIINKNGSIFSSIYSNGIKHRNLKFSILENIRDALYNVMPRKLYNMGYLSNICLLYSEPVISTLKMYDKLFLQYNLHNTYEHVYPFYNILKSDTTKDCIVICIHFVDSNDNCVDFYYISQYEKFFTDCIYESYEKYLENLEYLKLRAL